MSLEKQNQLIKALIPAFIVGALLLILAIQYGQGDPGRDFTYDISPDGTTVVFPGKGKGVKDLYLLDLTSKRVSRLIETDKWEENPRFSPDGRFIVYSAWSNPKETDHYWHLYRLDIKSRLTKQLTRGLISDSNPQFTPDGRFLVFNRATVLRNYSMGGKVWSAGKVCAMDLSDKNQKIVDLPLDGLASGIRNDGKAIVLSDWVKGGDSSKTFHVLVDLVSTITKGKLESVPYSPRKDPSGKVLGLVEPTWSPDGTELVFISWNDPSQGNEIWLANKGKAFAEQLTHQKSYIECLRYAPDNKSIYFLKVETNLMTMKKGLWKVDKNKVCSQVVDYTLFDNPLNWKPKRK